MGAPPPAVHRRAETINPGSTGGLSERMRILQGLPMGMPGSAAEAPLRRPAADDFSVMDRVVEAPAVAVRKPARTSTVRRPSVIGRMDEESPPIVRHATL
jgi:hypothetical protein